MVATGSSEPEGFGSQPERAIWPWAPRLFLLSPSSGSVQGETISEVFKCPDWHFQCILDPLSPLLPIIVFFFFLNFSFVTGFSVAFEMCPGTHSVDHSLS